MARRPVEVKQNATKLTWNPLSYRSSISPFLRTFGPTDLRCQAVFKDIHHEKETGSLSLWERDRSQTPPFDELRVVGEVEPREAGVRVVRSDRG